MLLVLAVDAGLPANPDVKLYGVLWEVWAVLMASLAEGEVLVLKFGCKFDSDFISTRSTGTKSVEELFLEICGKRGTISVQVFVSFGPINGIAFDTTFALLQLITDGGGSRIS